jgi:hypothetical protein
MAATLEIKFSPKTALTDTTRAGQTLYAKVNYTRELLGADPAGTPTLAPSSLSAELDAAGEARFLIVDGAADSVASARVETAQGGDLFTQDVKFPAKDASARAAISLAAKIYRGTPRAAPIVNTQFTRSGRFTQFTDALPEFSQHRLFAAPIRPQKIGQSNNPQTAAARRLLGLSGAGNISDFEVTRLDVAKADPASANALGLREVTLRSDGTFEFILPIAGDEVGWIWMLLGPTSWLGYQNDPPDAGTGGTSIIILPGSSTGAGGGPRGPDSSMSDTLGASRLSPTVPPMDFDEAQALTNPGLFADDPGASCFPFANPQRILGERPFFTVLRVDQPQVGSEGSLAISRPLILNLAPPLRTSTLSSTFSAGPVTGLVAGVPDTDMARVARTFRIAAGTAAAGERRNQVQELVNAVVNRPISTFWRDWLLNRATPREPVSPRHPIEWEGDPALYQAASVAGGHILENRVQWRSNGYSLGDVAHTLTLAPRQTRRISKVSWRRQERASRREITTATDQVTETTLRERDYSDAVASSLDEWSKGGSRSSTTGAAGGIGFALGPIVIGGGASHGSASSSSWQTGGRRVAASEQQQLRDAIRQFADSIRRLESTVVTEITQEEEVEGISETVRNINYCHALTVIYHEILRHYRVDTAFAGVRECLFVPFAISPFDVNKALKWRDKLRNGMLIRSLRWALDHLDEVANAWIDSNIPAGPRSAHPINYISGSAYIKLSIERPGDREEEGDAEKFRQEWTRIARLLGQPASVAIAEMNRENVNRDTYFQRKIAPTMASKWVNRLELVIGGAPVAADFTLNSSYAFGGTVRVDFTVPVGGAYNRESLTTVTLRTKDSLPTGSVANLTRLEVRYFTDHFDYIARSVPGANDLIEPDTGDPDTAGAATLMPLSEWERQDLRRVIEDAVDQLIVHLNANAMHYHKVIWWQMDRDELFMLLDGFTAPYGRRLENGAWVEDTGRSIASVVEREPLGILGNSLVYRVAGGVFLGIDGHQSPDELHRYYYDGAVKPQPLRVSLPTDGLYAQALMDSCNACEEHFGSTDWVLTNAEPELEALADQLGTRRSEPQDLEPSQFPQTLINLQNAPAAPDPTGLSGILQAVTNASAFRDMAGLAGTQANALGALTQAASLASGFGQMAVDFQKSKQGTADAKQKLSNIQKARADGLIDAAEAQRQSAKVLDEQNMSNPAPELTSTPEIRRAIQRATDSNSVVDVQRQSPGGRESVRIEPLGGDQSRPDERPSISILGSPAPGTNRGTTTAAAATVVTAFAGGTGTLKFNVTRNQVATSLNALLSQPDSLSQGNLNLCGPAAMLRTVLRRDPALVANFVVDLVEKGQARWGPRQVEPDSDLRNQTFKSAWDIGAAEWVAMSSLRDDENFFFDFEGTSEESLSGATTPGEIEDWLMETGLYTSVRDEANLVINEDKEHLIGLTFDNNHDNLLLIHSHLLRNAPLRGQPAGGAPATKKSDEFILRSFPNHWVVQASPASETAGRVKVDVWSWGAIYALDVPVATFEANYYGAVIARL